MVTPLDRHGRWRQAALAATILVTVPAIAQTPGLAMLDGLAAGQWVLNDHGHTADRILCITDWRRVLQLHNGAAACTHFTLDDTPSMVRVHYTCGSAGSGETIVRRESSRLVQLDTQGIDAGTPFSDSYEARFSGPCSAAAPGSPHR